MSRKKVAKTINKEGKEAVLVLKKTYVYISATRSGHIF